MRICGMRACLEQDLWNQTINLVRKKKKKKKWASFPLRALTPKPKEETSLEPAWLHQRFSKFCPPDKLVQTTLLTHSGKQIGCRQFEKLFAPSTYWDYCSPQELCSLILHSFLPFLSLRMVSHHDFRVTLTHGMDETQQNCSLKLQRWIKHLAQGI